MNKKFIFIALLSVAFFAAPGFIATAGTGQEANAISGKLVDGYRVLPVSQTGRKLQLNVFRGDYIKFRIDPSLEGLTLEIPELSIRQPLSRDLSTAPYFKMKKTGSFAFTLGSVSGQIHVTEYRRKEYRTVSAAEAAKIIASRDPLILDVRTPREFKQARLEDAVLIPVQVLQQNLDKLNAYKDREILIYCATGNRSTVAAKILIDNGFNHIVNLRHGIVDWYKQKFPVVMP